MWESDFVLGGGRNTELYSEPEPELGSGHIPRAVALGRRDSRGEKGVKKITRDGF